MPDCDIPIGSGKSSIIAPIVPGDPDTSVQFNNGGSFAGITGVTSTGNNLKFADNTSLLIGTGNDLVIFHSGTFSRITNNVGNLEIINGNGGDLILQSTSTTNNIINKLGTDTENTNFKVQNNSGNNLLIIKGAGNVGIGIDPTSKLHVNGTVNITDDLIVATSLIFVDKSNGTVTIGNTVTGTDRFNVFGPGTGVQQGIASFYSKEGGIKFRFRDEITGSIPPRLETESSLGMAFNTTTNSKYIWYINGTGNEKMRLTPNGLGIGMNPIANTIAGARQLGIANATTIPTGTVTGGGILYSTGGNLHWLKSDGTDVNLTP